MPMTPFKRFCLILALTAMWSPSFLFIKWAVADLPPFTIVTLRVSMATAIFALILVWKKRALPTDLYFWVHSFIMALFSSVMPFVLFCYAEKTIESALAAIINGCSPMFTALLAHICLPSDRIQPQKMLGISLSAAGLMFLFAPNIQNGLSGTTMGIMAGAAAAFCYAISHVYAKKFIAGKAPYIAPTAQLLCSSLIMAPLMLLADHPWNLAFPTIKAIAGVAGLCFFGTVLAFIIYYKLLEHCGPTAISMSACFFPVTGMLLGVIFLGETLSYANLGASVLIMAGLVLVNEMIDLKPIYERLIQRKQAST